MSFESFFHNILGREEAEGNLIADGVDKTYLARRSLFNADVTFYHIKVMEVCD